jgi:DnaK suppressor protein
MVPQIPEKNRGLNVQLSSAKRKEQARNIMTRIELDAFRRTLENRQAELGKGNRESLAIEASPDELDRIQNAGERDYAMGNLERDALRLREVRRALDRIRAGTFGVCGGCEEDINPKRLAAVPWASSCIVCQAAADRALRTLRGECSDSLVMAA